MSWGGQEMESGSGRFLVLKIFKFLNFANLNDWISAQFNTSFVLTSSPCLLNLRPLACQYYIYSKMT